jgi:putative intracellular protease/amidase
MTRIAKWIGGLLGVLLLLAGVGGIRARALLAREPAPMTATSFLPAPAPVAHDAAKPTVAVLLGADVTEITDMLAPYEMFARTRRYNVYAVAPSDASTTLTGGLRVRPHYSFQGLDRVLGGKSPAIVVAPNVPNIQLPANRSVHAEQYEPRLSDGVLFLNAAFRPRLQQFGVALFDGVGEIDVSSVYDAHAAAGVSQVRAIGESSGLVRTAHGIWLEPELVPQRDAAVLSSLDRVGLPGARAASAGTFVARSIRAAGGPEPELLHAQKNIASA